MSTRDKRPAPGQPRRSSGVALGVLGIMLLAFFAIVFMLGRPSYRHQFEEFIHHPFDPHPIGIDKRHKDTTLTDIDIGAGTKAVTSSTTTETEKKSSVGTAATPSPSPSPSPKAEEKKVEETKVEEKKAEDKPKEAAVAKESGDDEDDDGKITELDTQYKPTREMVQKIAQNGYLMVTWANFHYFDFVKTWVKHVQRVGVTGYIVGAMDDHLLREMIKLEYNCFSMKSGLTLGDFGWGSATFAKMGREKIRLISIFLKLDVHVVIADVDVLWLRNPLPYFERYPEADILTSSDNMANTVNDESLEKWPDAGAAANIGIMLFRKKSLDFVEKWIEIIEADDKVWDQNAFNDLFRRGVKPLEPPNKNLFLGYDGSLTMGILPVSIFCSGHTMYVQRMAQRLKLEPYAVHGTFQFSGTPGKRHRMREFMLYDDPPEYYDHPVGFVSFDLDGLPELLKTAGPATDGFGLDNVQGHFKLVNHELQRLRQGFAIASVITGRALVVPELWAGLDRWWAPHSGRIPGAHFDLPFVCPLDHLLDLENGMFRKFPEEHYGPSTEFREYSFFNNSRMTPAVRDDRVVVEVCDTAGAAGCSDGSKPAQLVTEGGVKKIKIAPFLSSAELATALSDPAVKGAKVLHFTSMAGFNFPQAFSEPGAAARFVERMKLYGSIWCCVLAHPGHIHYDLLWDMPHTDKFQRVWNGTWDTKTGP
ncbi:hypothetical protein CHLRE_14g629000v5 [Chlamydomonas reinhardtii]|uniref:Nucleotide-diphospho-sugar transferase domain-containing protein n=1 Tax=Chlamydomonas reinhardtii TaxID=3055 RepID=A8IUY7_CHLRE|nr:uncharacterized protein CHLRE_14g629000v5 [Chlamydomonas reinhardtii]PNW73352.1 hypothetical protein CHLRE_14g629000v5 [Chlamydomonas reinhardtii]|eukprot:XP_001692787.1 predicted protein [Chlamydomonas reinhardtii]